MRRRAPLLPVVIVLITILASLAVPAVAQNDDPADPGPAPGAIGEPIAPLTEKRLYDMANLFSNGQEVAIETDADRLARHGIPNLTVITLATMSPQDAEQFAAEVRQQWGVESGPGADDGLVILVNVSDTEQGRNVSTTLSWGDAALPHFGVTAETSAEIKQLWLDSYLSEGYLFEGVLFTLRRLIYHSIYEPAPQEPLTGVRTTLGTIMSVAGVALAIGALALAGRRWARGWQHGSSSNDIVALVMAWGVPALAVAVFVLSVAGHSGLGIMAALTLMGVAAADWVARDPRQATDTRGTP